MKNSIRDHLLQRQGEQGQVFVLLVLAFLVLLGFVALAIDGGTVYSDRRIAQNSADAASLAGAGAAGQELKDVYLDDWDCGADFNTAIAAAKEAAITNAAFNKFTITDTASITENLVTVECSSGGVPSNHYLDVKVRIDNETSATFSQFMFSGPLKNKVESVGRIFPRQPWAEGNTIVSLTDNCGSHWDKGIVFGGNGDTYIDQGGIHSNSCLTLNGSSGSIEVIGSIKYYKDDEYTNNGGMSISPTPAPTSHKISLDPIPDLCASVPKAGKSETPGELLPGTYNHIISINNNESITLQSGLYCLQHGIRVNGGGSLQSEVLNGSTEGGVTLVVLDGNFDTAGNAIVKLKAPDPTCDAEPDSYGLTCPPAMGGMLIYLPPGNDGLVKLAGTSDSEYTGTVYAPDGSIDVGGNTSMISEFWTQLIAYTVLIHGDTTMRIHYDGKLNVQLPAKLNLQR